MSYPKLNYSRETKGLMADLIRINEYFQNKSSFAAIIIEDVKISQENELYRIDLIIASFNHISSRLIDTIHKDIGDYFTQKNNFKEITYNDYETLKINNPAIIILNSLKEASLQVREKESWEEFKTKFGVIKTVSEIINGVV